MPIAPVGDPLFVALSQVSAKHVLLVKSPFTQATSIINGSLLLFVSAFMYVVLKGTLTHEVLKP
jgi:hypothetical protein